MQKGSLLLAVQSSCEVQAPPGIVVPGTHWPPLPQSVGPSQSVRSSKSSSMRLEQMLSGASWQLASQVALLGGSQTSGNSTMKSPQTWAGHTGSPTQSESAQSTRPSKSLSKKSA